MYTPEQLDILLREAMAGLRINDSDNTYNSNNTKYSNNSNNSNNTSNRNSKRSLTPAQALVIAGILGGSLSVFSVLADADQNISIVLQGSLKKKNNGADEQLDKIIAQLGRVPFDDIVAAMVRRLK